MYYLILSSIIANWYSEHTLNAQDANQLYK